ncbi:TetR/AcrR family transcriptional regulator [Actinomadura opuntiae]|uniref:TetR/AcrR family transcriptional regulator n=1 Tax=Actinomadura sp. OS1-43 TaxID=604315 RepID=UPI00255A7159|nr:TetR/AcrR family transcriptional regulator [Actinomadura sp. OS1-43]MDL4815175.1 TetR/AcrR family transcriptional regulator [Actinomadura sp. OS1-43]
MAKRPLDTPRALARRRQLIEAGFEHFADHDYDDVQLDQVTRAIGVSHGVVFQHFGTKKGFYLAIVEHLLDGFLDCVAPRDDLPAGERLDAGLAGYIGWAAGHPRGFASLINATSRFAEVRELVERARRTTMELIADGLGLDLAEPRVRIALRGWIGGLEATVIEWLRSPEAATERELAERMRATLAAALGPAAAPGR